MKQTSVPRTVVCHISSGHPAVDVRMFHRECLSLAQAKYEVHVIARHDRDETINGVRIHHLPEPPNRWAKFTVWPWLAYRKVLTIRPRPAICHFHDPALLPVGMALRLRGYKVVYDVHENVAKQIMHKEYIPRALRRVISWAYVLVERVLMSGMGSVHVLESIARHYRQPRTVARNLPRLSVASGACRSGTRNPKRLIYVGGISRVRGAMTMINVGAELRRRGVDFELRLVGDPVAGDGIEREMREAISQAGLADCVDLVGRVSFERAQAEIASAGIGLCLLHPIPNYLNSLPTKVFEYMSLGLPVVASDFDCWREYVTDTGAGVQVNVMDIPGIADTIEGLLADPDRMRRMGLAGIHAVESEYCWEKEQQKLLDFYRDLLAGRDRSKAGGHSD